MTDLRIALLASCTIDLLPKPLDAALQTRGLQSSIWVGGFGQYRQDILNPESDLYRHDPTAIFLYLDGADLFHEILENPFASADSNREFALQRAAEVAGLAETLAGKLPKASLLLNTVALDPLNPLAGLEYNSEYGMQAAVHAYNQALSALAHRLSNVVVVDVAALAASIGFDNWRDSRMWYLARSRWSRKALHALAESYTATLCARLGMVRKCIVLDLDNTLWGGIVGEDGLQGLRLGEEGIALAYVEFQAELLNLYRKGILLAICSKNNAEDALAVIRRHPSMRLREEHFAAVRINWDDKASNLRSLAEELNIGLDSLIFLDDNPVERSWVRQAVPEVMVPEWPSDPGEYKSALLELSARYLRKLRVTAEDRKRGEIYQAQAERRKLESSTTSLDDFYGALAMHARIGPVDSFSMARIAQLTQKTNQFNLTTRRRTEDEIRALSQDPGYAVWWLDLADRFGPNGIVGVLILKHQTSDAWLIDTFLLSCRVMGRTVENAFLAVVARELGATRLVGEFLPTAKNAPVRDLYSKLGFQPLQPSPEGQFWELNLNVAPLQLPAWFEIELVRAGAVVG